MIHTLICEICNQPIARFSELVYPVSPDQFVSCDPDHNPEPPFPIGVDWEFMSCPECRNRPFLLHSRVKIEGGYYNIQMPDGVLLDDEDYLDYLKRLEPETKELLFRIEADRMNPAELRQAKIEQEWKEIDVSLFENPDEAMDISVIKSADKELKSVRQIIAEEETKLIKKKPGRPKGSTDTKPRKRRK